MVYNTKNKLQATDFTPAESNLAKDSDSKITAKCYCPDPGRITRTAGSLGGHKSYWVDANGEGISAIIGVVIAETVRTTITITLP